MICIVSKNINLDVLMLNLLLVEHHFTTHLEICCSNMLRTGLAADRITLCAVTGVPPSPTNDADVTEQLFDVQAVYARHEDSGPLTGNGWDITGCQCRQRGKVHHLWRVSRCSRACLHFLQSMKKELNNDENRTKHTYS